MDEIGGSTMAMTADPCGVLERKVSDRVRDDESHRRVSEALTEVAIAAIHPARHLGVGRAASRGMLDDPIESATQAAVETLIRHLDDLVESLPSAAVSELACEQVMAERGLE
jgi:adenylate kinase